MTSRFGSFAAGIRPPQRTALKLPPEAVSMSANLLASVAQGPNGDAWRIQAIAELRFQTAFYMEAVQAMMDGATLGAERVQDKRIETLEIGVNTSPDAAIIMFVVTLILEGTIGPAIASISVSSLLRPILRGTANAIDRMEKVKDFQDMRLFRSVARAKGADAMQSNSLSSPQRVELLLNANELLEQAETLKQNLRRKLGATSNLRKTLANVGKFLEDNLVALVKAEIASGSVQEPTPIAEVSSPSVDLLAAVMTSAMRLRLTVTATHEALEATFARSATGVSEIAALLDDYRIDGSIDLAELRNTFAVATEAIIWSSLLVTSEARAELENRVRQRVVSASNLAQSDKAKLYDYLARRFDGELERWVLEEDILTKKEFEQTLEVASRRLPEIATPRPTGWWSTVDAFERRELIVLYLAHVAQNPALPELRLA